jgi:hypothetical protein
MKFLDSTYLYNKPNGLGIGAQPCPLIGLHSGFIRDPATGALTASKWMLEDRNPDLSFNPAALAKTYPKHFWEILSTSLNDIPQGGWVMLDAEGADSYIPDSNKSLDQNRRAFDNWKQYILAVKRMRPDVLISPLINWWHSADGANYSFKVNWLMTQQCDAMFREQINPIIDAIALEIYYEDWDSPPSPSKHNLAFNFLGSASQRYGFRDHTSVQHEWARALSGKPALHLLSIAAESFSSPDSDGRFLTGPEMSQCLDIISMYDPVAIGLWGTAHKETTVTYPDGWQVGTFNAQAPWLAEVKKRIT